MKILKHLPNFLTCLNLLSGFAGIVLIAETSGMPVWVVGDHEIGMLVIPSLLIFAGCFFDFFDGFAARWLRANSSIGKELDSLADVVTFGVLPGLIMWQLFNYMKIHTNCESSVECQLYQAVSLLIPVFSALRLAKFNVDTRQSDSFLGLPTPANAIFIASLPLIVAQGRFLDFILNPWTLIAVSVIMSFLLVSEIPLFALKFKDYTWVNNTIKYTFLAISLILLLSLGITAIPFIIIVYILISVVEKYMPKKSR